MALLYLPVSDVKHGLSVAVTRTVFIAFPIKIGCHSPANNARSPHMQDVRATK